MKTFSSGKTVKLSWFTRRSVNGRT